METLPSSPMPNEDSTTTENEDLNSLFDQYDVKYYFQSFPGAQNLELASYYEVHFNEGDADSLKNELKATELYGKIFVVEYAEPVSCSNPVGINDYWITQNWANNYALDMIEAECAWSITTGNNVTVAVIDTEIDTSHEDLRNQIDTMIGSPYSLTHGTWISGIVAAETNNNKGIASIGYNTKLAFYNTSGFSINHLWNRVWQAYQDGNKIMNVSMITIGAYPTVLAVKEMVDNNVVITLGAGNSPNANGHTAYAEYDGAIVVSSVDGNNNHGSTNHAHNQFVDLCAPGINVTTTHHTTRQTDDYGGCWGTSCAAPLVAGTVSLMRSVNPCLASSEVENMLKATCDTIADDSAFQGLLGAGRLNAYKAVQLAQQANSTSLDLYIKDRDDDFGVSGGYHWQAPRDNSPDIWVRNSNNGLTKQVHQDPEYNSTSPVYVYVRVRNKSCDTSSSQETLRLYWTKASSWSSWPQNWDGSQPLIGNVIDSVVVPPIEPGKDTILEFTWNILNPHIHNNWATCLLARIEDNPNDPITVYPGRIDDDVFFNNNIAMKNLTVLDSVNGIIPNEIDEVLYPPGRFMFVGNPTNQTETFDIVFSENSVSYETASLVDEAEIKIITDNQGWNILYPIIQQTNGIDNLNDEENSFTITDSEATISNVEFPANTRIPIYVGFSFLTEEAESEYYEYSVRQLSTEGNPLGGEYFEISRKERNEFYADAGNDKTIRVGETANLDAASIGEPAVFKWYDEAGDVYEGMSVNVEPTIDTEYTLEVTSENDGYKDYDKVNVFVQHNWIDQITPNPATDNVTVEYTIENGTNASLMILNSAATYQQTYSINTLNNQISLNLMSYMSGTYNVILIVDGEAEDAKSLIIQ